MPGDVFFFSHGFRLFYEAQVGAVRQGIFDFYRVGGGGEGGDVTTGRNGNAGSIEQEEVLRMQRQRIKQLEAMLHTVVDKSTNSAFATIENGKICQDLVTEGETKALARVKALEEAASERDVVFAAKEVAARLQTEELGFLQRQVNDAEARQWELQVRSIF